MVKPMIRGERVVLRPLAEQDAADLYAATLDPEGRRLTGTHARFTRQQIERWIAEVYERDDRVDLAVLSADDGRFLGEAVVNDIDRANRSAGFRIALAAPAEFGRGYGTEAARLILAFAFREFGLHRVELQVYDFNERARHVYARLGFRHAGVLRDALLWEGVYHDAIVMDLLEGELEHDR